MRRSHKYKLKEKSNNIKENKSNLIEKPYPWSQFFKDYYLILKGRRLKFLIFSIIIAISNLIPFLIAFLIGKIIDFFIYYNKGDPLNLFYAYVFFIGFAGLSQVLLRFYAKIRIQTLGANLRKEIRVKAILNIIDLELKESEKEETGSKIQKINQGSESVFKGVNSFINEGLYIASNLFGSLIIFLFLDIKYLLFSLFFISVYLVGEIYFNRKLSYWQDQLNKIKEKVSGKIHESTSNLLTVKSMGLRDVFKNSTQDYEQKYFEIWESNRKVSQLKFKTIKIFAAVSYALFILIVGFDVIVGTITAGSIVVFVNYFGRLRDSFDRLTNKSTEFVEIRSSVGRFMTVYGINVLDNNGGVEFPKNWKTIEFRNITFKYKNKNVLKNFSLCIKRNQKIGIVGKSGCGKSTLSKLLLGLYKPQKGEIYIDNIPLNKFKHNSITKNISIALQESEMFNLSLVDNITISSIKKDKNKFYRAINISQLKPIIRKLPNGINTLIGEKGYKLSGGEKQRLGIARALYKNSSIIIFDESTSNLDYETERKILNKFDKQLKDKTLLVSAHRLTTLKNMDKIYFIERGKVTEQGTYNQLIKNKGKFYKLWKQQKSTKKHK